MNRETVNRLCAAHPGAEHSDPWGGGHDCWKVGGKMFAVTGAVDPVVSVKTASIETAQMLIDAGVAKPARYLHRSWIALPLDSSEDELQHRIKVSYEIIFKNLPRKTQAMLIGN